MTWTEGRWRFRPLDAQHTYVDYQAITDPGGSLPAWAVNRVWCALLDVDPPDGPGAWASMLSLATFVLLLIVVIERKLRPVEVVR